MRTNGLYHNSAPGVTEHDPGLQGDSLDQDFLGIDDEDKRVGREQQTFRKPRRGLVGAALFLLFLAIVGAGIWLMFGGQKTRINVSVRDNAQKADQA